MSAPTAIAAVTQTLVGVLEAELRRIDQSCRVTTLAPDRSNNDQLPPNRLNLFLIQPSQNAALRNVNSNAVLRNGAGAQPPLAINLTYMITAYGEATPETKDQRILGKAMQVLNERPVLLPDAILAYSPGTGLEDQIDRVRIRPRDVSLEELSRMWSAFMTPCRTSAVYDVSVVLIDNDVTDSTALPVLQRGEGDSGVFTDAGLPPLLIDATAPELVRRGRQVIHQPAVELGQALTLEGDRLPNEGAVLTVGSPRWGSRYASFAATPGPSPGTLQFVLADPPPEVDPPAGATQLAWAPGIYSVAVAIHVEGRPDVVSNALPFALGPTVQLAAPGAAAGVVEIRVDCLPPPGAGQSMQLLLTGRPPVAPHDVAPPAAAGQPARITFRTKLDAGEYLAVLRVDGVDSMPYRVHTLPDGTPTLEYDPAYRIAVA